MSLPFKLSHTFQQFFDAEKLGGTLLIASTFLSLILANSPIGETYQHFWHIQLGGMSLVHWVNDGLMTIFFLLIGLELERELYQGELSDIRNALLPIMAAIGGMVFPALIHFGFNAGTPTQAGIGIPMATDIAFALAIIAMLGTRIPAALKVFIVAFAVIDDLGAAIVIALFYTAHVAVAYLFAALAVFAVLVALNRARVMSLVPYLIGGVLMWGLMLQSGVHPTLAGIALAFAIPFSTKTVSSKPFSAKNSTLASPSNRLEHALHVPVAYGVLPMFALANTGVPLTLDVLHTMWSQPNTLGVVLGLVVGKPLGVVCLSVLAVFLGWCTLPSDVHWRHIVGAGMLGGIGFTMSIFITNLAFADYPDTINVAKMAILTASLMAGLFGFVWLRYCASRPSEHA